MLARQPTGRRRSDRPWTSESTTAADCTFEQLAPYIGRIKTSIARTLVKQFTRPGDLLVDPFAGSGVIPFEAALLGRATIANDTNPYGVLLTRAKFSAPPSCDAALKQFQRRWAHAMGRYSRQDLRTVPSWVRKFFHPETLRNTLALRDALVASHDHFLLACLLGILHHQRPGFLSYPSSHLVPYLRDKLFPRIEHPELYEERDICVRMEAKIRRTYRRPPGPLPVCQIFHTDARRLALPHGINAVVTSPPYMNELDYIRDNRLRLWLLGRGLPRIDDIRKRDREGHFRQLLSGTLTQLTGRLADEAVVILVLGDTRRGPRRVDSARVVKELFSTGTLNSSFSLEEELHDRIPDIRRSRRDLSGTKRETILVYRLNRAAARRRHVQAAG